MSESSTPEPSDAGSSGAGSSGAGSTSAGSSGTRHTAGAFDIRVIIAGLIGAYGLILTGLGIFRATEEELARADGLNINLWAGLGMVAVALAFVLWSRMRPIIVPEPGPEQHQDDVA
ncbi:hypothetical protein ACHAAC_01165 [Aeromicrobium sp. CF4.19]|uniref:hypothetical protein n=1 Tax=Aeromicrobium sp. CF4.19 TaxID=3373082 RepID=UPI003EE7B087